MNILILSVIQVYPSLSGGQLRTGAFARALAKLGHDVSIYSFTGRKPDYLARKKSSATRLESGVVEFVDRRAFFGVCQWLCFQLEMPPLWSSLLARFFTPNKIHEFASSADLIIVDFPFLYPIADRLTNTWHLNTHNVEHQNLKKTLGASVVVPLMRKLERNAAKKAELVIACAPADKKYFADLNSVVLVPNGVFPEDYEVDPETRKSTRRELGVGDDETLFVFTGSNFGPNRSALDRLNDFCAAKRTFLSNNGVKFIVVGTVGAKSSKLAADELNEARIYQTGFVDSVGPYLNAADFALNPVCEGSGANVKNSQYISSKLPILTQEFGARGYELQDGVSCLKFTFDSLAICLSTALELSGKERQSMASRAFRENENAVSMLFAVKKYLDESTQKQTSS